MEHSDSFPLSDRSIEFQHSIDLSDPIPKNPISMNPEFLNSNVVEHNFFQFQNSNPSKKTGFEWKKEMVLRREKYEKKLCDSIYRCVSSIIEDDFQFRKEIIYVVFTESQYFEYVSRILNYKTMIVVEKQTDVVMNFLKLQNEYKYHVIHDFGILNECILMRIRFLLKRTFEVKRKYLKFTNGSEVIGILLKMKSK